METSKLGKTQIQVTSLGIGTWAWGDKLFWNYGKKYGESQVKEAFQAAIQAGITFFDTAEVYGSGKSESLLGEFMQEIDQPLDIATKYAPLPWRMGGNSVSKALTASLERLKLKQITLYQLHWPFSLLMSQETLLNTLADEVQKGRIKAIGVSNYSAQQMREAVQILAKKHIPLATNQINYSLLFRKVETQGIINTARQFNITILAYSPLAQGLLTGKYSTKTNNLPDGARQFDSRFNVENLKKLAPLLKLLEELGEKYQKTSPQIALNWLICQKNVIPIPGAKNPAQIRENIGALGWRLSADDIDALELISRPWL